MRKCSKISSEEIIRIYTEFKDRSDKLGEFALAVADSHGELMFFIKTDNCAVSSGPIAVNKAFTAARDRIKTSSLAAASAEHGFAVSSLGDLRYTGLSGGVPVIVDGECLGAVGVSGLTQQEDEELAETLVNLILS